MKRRRAGHVACMGGELQTGFWRENFKERYNLGDIGAKERIVLKLILK
jgi:hypothetical protein